MELKAPDIQLLLVDGLVVPDWNPRKTMSESGLAALEAHVKAGGTIQRILVWGGDGKSVISGQRRLTVYRRLGKTHIEAEILHVSLDEAKRLARTSNRGEALNWLEEYEGWEGYFEPGSKLTDGEIGAIEGVDGDWIGRARALLVVLNPASRSLIRESLVEMVPEAGSPIEPAHPNQGPRLVASAQGQAKNKGNNDASEPFGDIKKPLKKRISKNEEKWVLLEKVAFPLTRLWDKRTIQEAQDLVEKTLPVILARQMNSPQVKALVKWVSTGNAPEAFRLSPDPQVRGQALAAPSQSGVGTGATQAGSVGKATPVQETGGLKEPKAVSTPNSQFLTSNSAEPDIHSQVATAIASHELGKKLHVPSQIMNWLFPPLTRLFHRARGLFTGLGIKNPTLGTFLTLLLFLFVGSFLYNLTARLMNGLWNGFVYSMIRQPTIAAGGQPQVAQPVPQSPMGAGGASVQTTLDEPTNRGQSQGSVGSKGEPAEAVSAQAGEQAGASGNRNLVPNQGVSTPNSQLLTPKSGKATPATNPTQVAKGEDPLKAIGDGVKDYQSAVSTAGDAKSATDKAKGLLPF